MDMRVICVKTAIFFLLLCVFSTKDVRALEPWTFKKTYESKKISENPFNLSTSADLNSNGTKEIIFTDFSLIKAGAEDINRSVTGFNLFVVEWRNDQLNINYHKKWEESSTRFADETTAGTDIAKLGIRKNKEFEQVKKGFSAFKASQLVSWQIGNKVYIETMPPYFGLQWKKGEYVLDDEQVWGRPDIQTAIGSWALPWISPTCYSGFVDSEHPQWDVKAKVRECLIGIRDFSANKEPEIVSILVEEIIKDKQYKDTVRVRQLVQGFPVRQQIETPSLFRWWRQGSPNFVDPINWQGFDKLLMFGYKPTSWYMLKLAKTKGDYELTNLQMDKPMGVESFILPYIYLRKTQSRAVDEYWGYRTVQAADKGNIVLLRKAVLKPDSSGFEHEDIDFQHHEPFLGVGYFDLKDVDGDGLDEIILTERTGKRKIGEDSTYYSDIKEYIHILKWNGQTYQAMWVSPPYTKIGTKFIADDIKNSDKSQLIVLTPHGTIQIWERQ